jgi:membrane protein DedA with SNARE-associated domain
MDDEPAPDLEPERDRERVDERAARRPGPLNLSLGRAQAICAAGLFLTGLYALAFVPAAPSLLGTHPVRLELLRASTPALVAGGAFARVGRASLILALLAPLPTLMMSDPFFWWAGRLWGPDVTKMLVGAGPRAQRRTQRALRMLERWDEWAIVFAYLLPVPSAVVYAAAGWSGMSLRRFLFFDLIGTAIWVGGIVGLGYAIGHPAVHVAKTISHYGLYATIALIVGIVVYAALADRRRSG